MTAHLPRLEEIGRLDAECFAEYGPYHAVRADVLRRLGNVRAACEAYAAAIDLVTTSAERKWLTAQRARLSD